MIQFEDAKKQVESLFGPIRGYKGIYQNFYGMNNSYSIGTNYVFVGNINIWNNYDQQNQVWIYDINGISNNLYIDGYPTTTKATSMITLEIMAKDNDFGTMVDLTLSNYREYVSINGWIFQIDK